MNGLETKKPFYKKFWFYLIAIPFFLYVMGKYVSEYDQPSKETSYPNSSASYNELNTEVGCDSKYSKEKKKDIFESRYKNRWMTWTGEVLLPNAESVSLNLDGVGTQDLHVKFAGKNAGYNLIEGEFITVRFVMKYAGGCFLPFSGDSAVIIK